MSDSTSEDALDARRKRLVYQSGRRGTKEADMLLGGFAGAHAAALDAAQLDRFEALLNENDVDLMDWITGRRAPPSRVNRDLMDLLRRYANLRR